MACWLTRRPLLFSFATLTPTLLSLRPAFLSFCSFWTCRAHTHTQFSTYPHAAFTTGLKLPGSRSDVVRTKSLSGPSPVGGAMGGLESQAVLSLDEFELQAAHYNMACAHAQLGNLDDALGSLEMAFQAGFDNYATVRGDADLDPIKSQGSFDTLMETYEPKKGFNPFGLFGGK